MNIDEWIKAGKPWNVILHGDCNELMGLLPDKYFELDFLQYIFTMYL